MEWTSPLTMLILLGAVIVVSAIALGLTFRHGKSAAERERERRLKINAIGRICDGCIEKVTEEAAAGGGTVRLLHYSYSVAGASYSAAQDVSTLLDHVQIENCAEGAPISVKYDPENPSNSIVVCEHWSGLR